MNENKDVLKFITCGSVDDGKSTLIGKMLFDAKMIYADQKQALELRSQASRDKKVDYSLLLDGLMAEREQGITIDVAYRYFATEKRNFIVADCPGHEQYTRNMAVGASFADLAVLLVDARSGVLAQTIRHLNICGLMGIKHVILAVNKMDLIDYNQTRFEEITRDFYRYTSNMNLISVHVIPVSATEGDNVTNRSNKTPWYQGQTLFYYLEHTDVLSQMSNHFSMPVQRVTRPDHTFRGYQGCVEEGFLNIGDEVMVYPEKHKAKVTRLFSGDTASKSVMKGQAITVCLDKEIDIRRGQVISKADLMTTDLFKVNILWMDRDQLKLGKNYLLKIGTRMVNASIASIDYRIDIQTGKHLSAKELFMNELARVTLMLSEKITIDTFEKTEALGSFILMDRMTNRTAACGVVIDEIKRSEHITWQDIDITREIRANQKNQTPKTIWLTGLSGAGKTTIANALERKLIAMGMHTILLDGDNLRHGLNKDLGFDQVDRIENIRRVSETCKLMNEAGLIVIAAFISPYENDRKQARVIVGDAYKEVFLSTPLEVCEDRDVKGLYKKARKGEILDFTGVHTCYEIPQGSDLSLNTETESVEACVESIVQAFFKEYKND
ncbi:adenylyl-sulfate kinase [Acidaminobacter sp. JC074]|uniref:adenylyl-sulfate kinase n=1 Tax=Acidaminobacter sp. JC074 TaxID=2530199 RepID=UPI001F0D6B50|nr:adenylyl-sulfate kinase [Acidaminobacter sp. JC074]MCH4889589.1 adenylyl-sulfate kinase [Acidaminobacter sp. JC074]